MTNTTTPAVAAPSALPLNLGSLARWALTLSAGWLASHGRLSAGDADALAGTAIALGTAAWNLVKNHNVVTTLIAAMQAPAVNVAPAPASAPD